MSPILSVAQGNSARTSAIASQDLMPFPTFAMLFYAHMLSPHAGCYTVAEHIRLKGSGSANKRLSDAAKDTAWFSPALFREPVRNNANVVSLSAFVGDLDENRRSGGRHTIDSARAALDGLNVLIATTYSHTPRTPALRVMIPYTRYVTPAEHAQLYAYFQGRLDGGLGKAAKDSARLWYWPSHCVDNGADVAHTVVSDAAYFNPDTVLTTLPPAPPQTADDKWTTEDVWAVAAGTVEERIASYAKRHPNFDAALKGDGSAFKGPSEIDQSVFTGLLVVLGGNCEAVLGYVQDPDASVQLHSKHSDEERWLRLSIGNALPFARGISAREPHIVFANTPPLPAGASREPLQRTAARANDIGISTKAPYDTAKVFRGAEIFPSLKCWQSNFFYYRRGIYLPLSHDAVRAALYPFVQAAGLTPNRNIISNIHDALKADAHLEDSIQPPAWIDDPLRKIPGLIICRNGMFDLDTGAHHPLTPNLFSLNALPMDYDPNACAPSWIKFLDSVWRSDSQSIETLQEMCGLLLTPFTGFQKLFLLCGPRRSGKGTILRVIRAMLGGTDNVASPTLGSLAGQFGLQPLIGKLAAFVGDVRLSNKVDQSVLVERLLSITGEDNISIPRKHTTDFDTKLAVRFVFSSNEVPRLADASGAAASRFIVLSMTESFYGREDLDLERRLMAELPGILAWCIEGRHRLMQRGHFVQPESARDQISHLEDLGRPLAVFLRETCTVGAGGQVAVDVLFNAWAAWCARNHRPPGDAQTFGRDLHASVKGLKMRRPRVEGDRIRVYEGIALTHAGLAFGAAS